MKLKAALIVVTVLLLGLAAWSQNQPKVELSIDYSYLHYGAIDFDFHGTKIGRNYNLNGGGVAVVWNLSRYFGLKGEFQGYGSSTRNIVIPPGNPYLPAGGAANVNGDLFTYLFGPQVGRRYGIFRPYAHGLVGGAHNTIYRNAYNRLTLTQVGSSPTNNAFAAVAGAGLDIAVSPRFSIRPFELSYIYTDFSNKLTNNQNSWRYLGGVVINFGGAPPVPPTAACSASPASVKVGEPVTVTATGSNFNPKHTLTYLWTISGGKLSSTNTQSATVDTTGMSDGTHTADATITDPKGPKNANVANCGANFNVNVPHNPPQVTCSANPTTVKPGESSTITASATSPDQVQISSYAYTASAGTVTGSGESATLSTTSDMGGQTVNVTVTATDARGLTGTCTARVAVAAPPTISCVSIEDWGECTFEKDPKRPWRVDNDCKDTLDKLALRLQQMPNGKLKVVGYTDEKEVVSEQTIGAQRAVNVKFYMTQDELGPKADATRIEPRQGGTKGKATHFYFVADGALCSGQEAEGTPVDESAVQGQSRSAAPKSTKHKKAAAPQNP